MLIQDNESLQLTEHSGSGEKQHVVTELTYETRHMGWKVKQANDLSVAHMDD